MYRKMGPKQLEKEIKELQEWRKKQVDSYIEWCLKTNQKELLEDIKARLIVDRP